jgi:pimeloyl-ACP methyl ester carboxylesterase
VIFSKKIQTVHLCFIGFIAVSLSSLSISISSQAIDGINLIFHGSNSSDTRVTTVNSNFARLKGTRHFSETRPTVVYVHGWRSGLLPISTRTVVEAYISRGDHNVIAVDWSKHSASVDYVDVAMKVDDVAGFIVTAFRQMQAVGFNLSTFHLVGHSLGAQVLGRVGHQFAKKHNFVFRRITGLDPAGPMFGSRKVEFFGLSFTIKEQPTLNRANAQ